MKEIIALSHWIIAAFIVVCDLYALFATYKWLAGTKRQVLTGTYIHTDLTSERANNKNEFYP